jgi:post-segregation antitoxin (ccd killing protein)
MATMNKKPSALIGNKNAAKPDELRRVPLTIRLPPDLIKQLRARGNVTAQIEGAIKKLLQAP